MSLTDEGASPQQTANQIKIERREGMTDQQLLTELAMSPLVRNTMCAKSFAAPFFHGDPPQLEAALDSLTQACSEVRAGNVDRLTDMLVAQAMTLDTIFTEYSRRSLLNAGEYVSAAKTYATLAAKAQANCRSTIEAIGKIKRGGKQTVRVVHVHEGGQAVVAETINQGGAGEGRSKQPHAKAADASVATLHSPDQTEHGLPIAGHAERKVSHARR